MPINCPPAPVAANPALIIQTTLLKAGSAVTRFHSKARAGSVYNPNTGKRIEIEEDGARFNPFPGAPAANVATLYAADNLTAAALESIFHGVKQIPSPTFPRIGLKDSCYSELAVNEDLVVLELTNPQLRQLAIPHRRASLKEDELIHTPPSRYPHTRTWARFLHDSLPALQGLCWRPRLGGTGLAYMFFGDRCSSGALTVTSGPIDIDSGSGFVEVFAIAQAANIKIIG
jgi:RES domain